jgi:hypothetical protein
MSADNEIIFNSIEELFNHIMSRGGANQTDHGTVGTFVSMMQNYTNPNACSCKKTKAVRMNILSAARTFNTLSGQHLVNVRALFDGKVVILREANQEIARF